MSELKIDAYTSLSDGVLKSKLDKLVNLFKQKYGADPQFAVRVPGRVNLIGEHIDYCGYAVHPMAIEQAILVVFSVDPNSEGLELINMNPEKYPDFRLDSLKDLEIKTDKIHWWSYFLCGLKGVFEENSVSKPPAMKVALSGEVPPSAGLSSSSALVVSAALAAVCGTTSSASPSISREELASLCAKAERFIGTQGGGMDQAIELLAVEGKAKLIEFNPLATTDVSLPPDATFLVANSLQEKNKAASNEFNTRVVECRLAAKLLAKHLIPGERWKELLRLKDVQVESGKKLEDMKSVVESILTKEVYLRSDVLQILGISDEFLRSDILTPNTQEVTQFKLRQRARHVYSEAARVYKFKEVCSRGGDDALVELGQLMNASHDSCQNDYECSAPQLDLLVQTDIKLGALGARLTGAGWGGCAVALIHKDKADGFIDKLQAEFYAGKNSVEPPAFITKPGGGASIWRL